MTAYWVLFLLPAICATHQAVARVRKTGYWPVSWWGVLIALSVMIGLRHEVGGDWANYEEILNFTALSTFSDAMERGDPAYAALNWVAAYVGGGIYLVNFVCAVLFSIGLIGFCQAQPRPWLALTVAVPFLVIVVAMGYTRQGVAIGLAMLALTALSRQQILRFVLLLAVAAAFHKSAVILMPLAVFRKSRNRLWTASWIGVCTILLYLLVLADSMDLMTSIYFESAMESAGAAIRVSMNAVPAGLFLLFRDKFEMAPAERKFWTWMSFGAFALVGLLLATPSSTAVDRIALYWIPLQLFVLSRLPDAVGRTAASTVPWTMSVVLYSALVLGVWLNFADHAYAWVPYQFYPSDFWR